MRRGFSRVAMTVAAMLGAWAQAAWAGDPALDWYTIESPHFVIHYYAPNHDAAVRVARVAEHAHDLLVPVMEWEPEQRTHIVLTDDTDSENGSATVLPYNVVTLFLTAPDPTSSLADYDDYLGILITHEYTHILHMENIHG